MEWINVIPLIGFLIYISIISGRIVLLKRKGIRVNSRSAAENKRKYLLYPFFSFIFLLMLFEMVRIAVNIPYQLLPEAITRPLTESEWTGITGTGLALLSIIVLGSSLYSLSNSLRFGLDADNSGTLTTSGIYSVSRNPFFLSIELLFVGTALQIPSPLFILLAVLTITTIHFYILKEERFLYKKYGDAYSEYKRKVRRYF